MNLILQAKSTRNGITRKIKVRVGNAFCEVWTTKVGKRRGWKRTKDRNTWAAIVLGHRNKSKAIAKSKDFQEETNKSHCPVYNVFRFYDMSKAACKFNIAKWINLYFYITHQNSLFKLLSDIHFISSWWRMLIECDFAYGAPNVLKLSRFIKY